MVKTTSAVSATARGDSPQRIPWSNSHCAFDFVRLYPVTVWPASRSRFVTRPPMAPNPTNPRLAITTSNWAEPGNKKTASLYDRQKLLRLREPAPDEHAWQRVRLRGRAG